VSLLGQFIHGTALPEQWLGAAVVMVCIVGCVAYRLRGGRLM